MSKVYVLISEYDYEGQRLHGVFSTEEKAWKFCDIEFGWRSYNTEVREVVLDAGCD